MKGYAQIAFVILAIAALLVAAKVGIIPADLTGTGFSTLSASQAQVVTDSNVLSGKQWVITISQDGSGGSLEGRFSPEDIKEVTVTGETPQYPFTFKMEMTKNQVQYPISAIEGEKLYVVNIYDIGTYIGATREERLKTCIEKVGGGFDVVNPPGLYTSWYCLQRFEQGTLGKAAEGSVNFESKATLARDGSTPITANINNLDSTSVNLGTVGHLKWQGNLVTGQQVPVPTAQDVCFLNGKQSGAWASISCENYNTYKGKFANFASCVYSKQQQYKTGGNECVQDINNAVTTAQQQKTFMVSGGTQAQTSGTLGSGQVVLPLPKQFQFPVFTLRIKADYIGIVIPAGIPKIDSVTSEKFSTGGTGLIKVTVRNAGNSLGSFDIAATCQAPFSSDDRTRVNVNPGQSADVYLKVFGQTATDATNYCRVVAFDVNQPTNRDEKIVQVSVTTVAECREGTTDASGRLLRKCIGGKWQIVKECPEGEKADPISFTCVKDVVKGSPSGGGLNLDFLKGLGDAIGKLIGALIVGAILLIFLVALSLFLPFLAVFAVLKNPKIFIGALIVLALIIFFVL